MLRIDIGYAESCSLDWLGVRLDYVVMAYGSLCMIKREMLLADRDRFLPTEDIRYVHLDFSLHMSLRVFEDTKPSLRFRRTFSTCGDGRMMACKRFHKVKSSLQMDLYTRIPSRDHRKLL